MVITTFTNFIACSDIWQRFWLAKLHILRVIWLETDHRLICLVLCYYARDVKKPCEKAHLGRKTRYHKTRYLTSRSLEYCNTDSCKGVYPITAQTSLANVRKTSQRLGEYVYHEHVKTFANVCERLRTFAIVPRKVGKRFSTMRHADICQ